MSIALKQRVDLEDIINQTLAAGLSPSSYVGGFAESCQCSRAEVVAMIDKLSGDTTAETMASRRSAIVYGSYNANPPSDHDED